MPFCSNTGGKFKHCLAGAVEVELRATEISGQSHCRLPMLRFGSI
jgi:hypothetical protein